MLNLALLSAAAESAQCTTHRADFVGLVETGDRLVQSSISQTLDADPQGRQLPHNSSLDAIGGDRPRYCQAQADDQPCDENGAMGFGGEIFGLPVNGPSQLVYQVDGRLTGLCPIYFHVPTQQVHGLVRVAREGR